MAAKLISRSIQSLTAGVATPISTSDLYAGSIILVADALNTGNIYYGGSTVTAVNGIPIAKNGKDNLSYDLIYGVNTKWNLKEIYLDADTTGNAVRILYTEWQGF